MSFSILCLVRERGIYREPLEKTLGSTCTVAAICSDDAPPILALYPTLHSSAPPDAHLPYVELFNQFLSSAIFRIRIQEGETPWWVRRFDCGRRHCAKNSGPAGHATPMASGNAPKTAGHGEEPTPPPPGMYWVQMQGLWALRPTADVDDRNAEAGTDRQRESQAGSTLEQQGALLTDADRQWLAQSAGAACSASALTEASALSEGAGSSRPEIQPRTQGVVEFNHQHCSPSFAAAVARDTAPLLQPHPSTPAPLPAPQPQPQEPVQEDMPEQQHLGWPDWLIQWGRRVEEEEASHHAPSLSAPPSALLSFI